MFPCSFPATASMILKKDRIKTFVDWNFTIAPPELLAAAGFFSLGETMCVCYFERIQHFRNLKPYFALSIECKLNISFFIWFFL